MFIRLVSLFGRNSFCEWLLTADEGEIIEVEVMTSDMESDCSDVVLVFDGEYRPGMQDRIHTRTYTHEERGGKVST